MLRTMITATNTMSQLQNQLDVIGNNLSNSNTHGYKSKNINEFLINQRILVDKM